MAKEDILVKLIMEKQTFEEDISKIKQSLDGLDKRRKEARALVDKLRASEAKLELAKIKITKANKDLSKSNKDLVISQTQVKNASGAATSSVLELGRVIQDAPYGIRGMGNNITQLASQMAFTAKAAGGLRATISALSSALFSPVGAILAISAIVSGMEMLEERSRKTKKEVSEFAKIAAVSSSNFTLLTEKIKSSTASVNEKRKAYEELNKKYPDFIDNVKKEGDEYTINNDEIERYIRLLENRAKAQAVASLVQEKFVEKITLEEERRKEVAEKTSDLINELEDKNYDRYRKGSIERVKELTSYLKTEYDLNKTFGEQTEDVKSAVYDLESIQNYRDELGRLAPVFGSVDSRIGDFLKSLSINKSEINDVGKEIKELISEYSTLPTDNSATTNKKDRVDLLGLDMIDPKKEADRANKILKSVVKHIDKDLFTKEFGKELEVAPKLSFELSEETKAGIDAYNKLVRDMISDKFNAENIAEFTDGIKTALSGINDFTDALFDRQLVTEQNKTNELNAELNNRLLNENLSAEKRKDIQNQIAQNDEKLRKKQNEIKKKAFNTNKAFQLSMAIADTASSVLKAYGSQLIVGDPSSIIRAKVAAGLAGAMGALQIATIATQKFQPDAATTPIRTTSGAGGGVGNRSFDFNLVGNNQGNQVVDAIQSQFDKPIKAYVVSKDITNAQQLDANTKSSARFGG